MQLQKKRKEKSPKSVDIYTQSLNQATSSSVEKVSESIKKSLETSLGEEKERKLEVIALLKSAQIG